MKKIFTILVAVLLTVSVFAQTPQKMSYQAVIRNSSKALVTNTQIGMEINIHQSSPTGTVVYTETQAPTTNANGLVSIEIGGGAVFSTINWASNNYYIETKTAIVAPLTTYTIISVSQLLSVPYALHAKTAENSFSGNYIDLTNKPIIPTAANGSETKVTAGTNITVTGSGTTVSPYVVNSTVGGGGTHYLGEEYLGGIIFYLYNNNTGTQKGLIVSKTENIGSWSGATLVGADKTSNGFYNMALMPTGVGTARTWVETLGVGWYLPSVDELGILWHNRYHVNNSAASGLTLLSITGYYCSSTEYNATLAFGFDFNYGYSNYDDKPSTHSVRAVRAF